MLHIEGNTFDVTAKEKINKLKKGDVVLIYYAWIDVNINASIKRLKELKIYIDK